MLGLIAHDRMKPALADWVARHLDMVRRHALVATGTTGARLFERFPDLTLTRLATSPATADCIAIALAARGGPQ